MRRLHLPPDGRRDEPPPRSFGDKLKAFRAQKEADKGLPMPSAKTPVQQGLPLKEFLAKSRGRPSDRAPPLRPTRKGRDDDRER